MPSHRNQLDPHPPDSFVPPRPLSPPPPPHHIAAAGLSLDLAASLRHPIPSPPFPSLHQRRREDEREIKRGTSSAAAVALPPRSASVVVNGGRLPPRRQLAPRRGPPCSLATPPPFFPRSFLPSPLLAFTVDDSERRRWLSPRELSAAQAACDPILLRAGSKASSFSLGRTKRICLEYLYLEHKVEENPQRTKVRPILRSHGGDHRWHAIEHAAYSSR